MVLKRLGAISFGLAFVMAVLMYLRVSVAGFSPGTFRMLFLAFGALGLLFNFISFATGKHSPLYSFAYWLSSLVIFAGLIFRWMHWPYSDKILIVGLIGFGVTLFIPSKREETEKADDELLDNF